MELERIERGWSVFSEDGKRVGDVVEVHPHYILVSRGLLVVRDVYVPRYAVGSVEERRVVLAIPEDRLRRMAWNTPPPEPPEPVDAPTPRLVPTAEEEEQNNPFTFAATGEDELTTADEETAIGDDYAYTPDESEPEWDDYEDMGILFGSNVEIDGEVYLATQRLGDGPPIVFVHGWGCDRRIWDYLTLDLPNDHTVVTYDGRGYGRSTAPWVGYEVARMSHDLRVVLRTLDLTGATIVGLDLGAAAALHYALDGGRRVGRLVLIAPAIPPDAIPAVSPVDDEDSGDHMDMEAAADDDATVAGADATDTEIAQAEMPQAETEADAEAATIDAQSGPVDVVVEAEQANSGMEAAPASIEADVATEASGIGMGTEPAGVGIGPETEADDVEPDTASAPVDPYADWRALLRHDRPRLASEVAAAWAPGASAETTAWLRDGFLAAAPYALAHGLDALDAPNLPGALSDLTLPVTVLGIARDPFIPPDWARRLAEAIPGSRLVELDTDAHLPMVLDPERLAQEIRTALDE